MPARSKSQRGGPEEFQHLLSPLRVGRMVLRNRVIMGSMHTRLEQAEDPLARQIAFYAERARGGVALIITGGFSPNSEGMMEPGAPVLDARDKIAELRAIASAVQNDGAKIALQILHAGRYAKHDQLVGASNIASPINPRKPRRLSSDEIEATIEDHVRCASLAAEAGFDGVEIMGSEGYLITQFTAPRTNDRADQWGGSAENRRRFPVAIVRGIRERLGADFLIIYRISALDLVEGGATAEEIDALAQAVETAGADILNTGIGWHEARIPTIAASVPRAAWSFAASRLKKVVTIPVVASNRINRPEIAEKLLADGDADLVSLARPLLADPDFVAKAASNRVDEINVCIACNQACLDFIFSDRVATCLVNPRAGRETEIVIIAAQKRRRIAVVGAGPAGLAFAATAAERGHSVTLFESAGEIGGQFQLARRIPGKEEFAETLRYFAQRIERQKIELRLRTYATAETIIAEAFEHVVVACGVRPRRPVIDGADLSHVVSYGEVISGAVEVGETVAIIGAGGIGFDVAHFLSQERGSPDGFHAHWGVDRAIAAPGGLSKPEPAPNRRRITVLQRSAARPGRRLGVSTGWILRAELQRAGVKFLAGCHYRKIDAQGVHVTRQGREEFVRADSVVLCAGQTSLDCLSAGLADHGISFDVIGGAQRAAELDAYRAIREGVELACKI